MKSSFSGMILVLSFGAGSSLLRAQTNADTTVQSPNPQVAHAQAMLSFLTPAEQEQYAKARAKALADNSDLKTEGENLMKEGQALMAQGTMEDKQAFLEAMNAHRQKLRQAMLKEDPTLEPIFVEIDKHILEMKTKYSDSAPDSSSGHAPAGGSASP
jgi:hypothetical protein